METYESLRAQGAKFKYIIEVTTCILISPSQGRELESKAKKPVTTPGVSFELSLF